MNRNGTRLYLKVPKPLYMKDEPFPKETLKKYRTGSINTLWVVDKSKVLFTSLIQTVDKGTKRPYTPERDKAYLPYIISKE